MKLKIIITISLLIFGVAILPINASARDYGNKYGKHKTKHVAGKFDYYDLVLSWSPTYCETGGTKRRDQQCLSQRPFAFVLHGLWPQYNRGYPSSCWLKKRPWISKDVINSMLDIMPSKGLIIHEYKKHGTCSGLSPEKYYQLSRYLYNKIKIPPLYKGALKPMMRSPKEIENDFLIANPELKPEMISIVCGKRRLKEVRICFSRSGDLRNCGQNEYQKKLCRLPKVYVPPMRSASY